MTPVWHAHAFAALDGATVYALLRLRSEVFVVEQACAYLDPDGKDLHPEALHVFALDPGNDAPRPLAYLRALPPGLSFDEPSIGRVVTANTVRGSGLGHALMRQGIAAVATRWPGLPIRIGAQAHLQGFYAQHGFVVDSAPFLEDGIPHVEMLRSAG
jgi:ElaA protein